MAQRECRLAAGFDDRDDRIAGHDQDDPQ